MITEESVQLVKDTARVEDIVGDYVNLKRRGQNLIGLCPFHGEKTPSFNVNPARNIYKCFGCGEAGDPIKFLMSLEQLSFVESIRKIAARYNIKLEEKEVSAEVRQERQEKEALILVNEFAQRWYAEQLYETNEGKSVGLSYFRSRGFRRDTMEAFGLGYAPAGNSGLMKAALAAGYKRSQLEQLGLVRHGKDFFWDRVMFTIHNLQGRPIAFAGRILKTDVKAPKYVNSPESEIYHKSDVLYGLHQARAAVRKQDNVYMVEGYTDVISLYQHGVRNVVATSGTSLTLGQARLVKRQTENVTLLYDGDKAGVKAALRGVDVLLTAGLNVRVVILPEGEDPDSYMQQVGLTAFEEYLEQKRRDFLFFKADLLLEEAGDDVAARSAAIRSSIATLALVEDPLKRAGYLQQFTGRLGLEESLLVNLVNQAVSERRQKAQKDQEREERQRALRARTQVQGKDRRQGGTNRRRPAADAPPRPADGDDGWVGLQEPGGYAPDQDPGPAPTGDDGWAGLQEPGFAGPEEHYDGEAPFGPADLPTMPYAGGSGTDPLLLTGHTFQEMDLVRLLILHGAKPYDEAGDTSVAAYLTANVADVLGDFDHEPSRRAVTLVTDYVAQHRQGPPREWYLNHPDEHLRARASAATRETYTMSPNWREKYKVYLRQKPPEENHRLYADNFLRIFRMEKVDRKCRQNIQKIKDLELTGEHEQMVLHMKLQMKLVEMRKALAAELGTVVL